MNKVKIKSVPGNRPERGQLLSCLSLCNVKCYKVHEIRNDGFILWCNSDTDVDVLFSKQCVAALKGVYCEPQLPPEVKVKRTVLLRRVDDIILGKREADITAELHERNNWLNIVDIYKFPNSPTIKLICATNEMAVKTLEWGVKLFDLSIPAANIVQEVFVNLVTCYRCYAIKDHQALSCNKPKEYRICSVCAMTGHTFRQCTATTKKCINCGGPHSTLAMSCPERKRFIKERKKAKVNQKSYSAAANSSQSHQKTRPTVGGSALMAKAFMCLTLSTMKNAKEPGSFERTLNHLLQANDLPSFSLGGIAPPTMRSLAQADVTTGSFDVPSSSGGTEDDEVLNNESLTETSTVSLNPTTIYKKKDTPEVTPNNLQHLFSTGSIVIDCPSGSESRNLEALSSSNIEVFSRRVNITELKPKEFDIKAGTSKVKRSQRNIGSSQST